MNVHVVRKAVFQLILRATLFLDSTVNCSSETEFLPCVQMEGGLLFVTKIRMFLARPERCFV